MQAEEKQEEIIRRAVFISSHPIGGTGSNKVSTITGLHKESKRGFEAIIFGDLHEFIGRYKGNCSDTYQLSFEELEKFVGVKFSEVDLIVIHLDTNWHYAVNLLSKSGIPGFKVVYAVCKCGFKEKADIIAEMHKGTFAVEVDCAVEVGRVLTHEFGHLIRRWWISGHITKFRGSVAHPHYMRAIPAHI